jgi:hypothetical protein
MRKAFEPGFFRAAVWFIDGSKQLHHTEAAEHGGCYRFAGCKHLHAGPRQRFMHKSAVANLQIDICLEKGIAQGSTPAIYRHWIAFCPFC